MLFGLLLSLNILICIALIGVVLLQRAEGGVLGGGGNPTGLITTRGAGDLLTRTTWILFSAFLVISLSLDAHRGSGALEPSNSQSTEDPVHQSQLALADKARNERRLFGAGQHRARANRNGSATQSNPPGQAPPTRGNLERADAVGEPRAASPPSPPKHRLSDQHS